MAFMQLVHTPHSCRGATSQPYSLLQSQNLDTITYLRNAFMLRNLTKKKEKRKEKECYLNNMYRTAEA